MRSDTLPNQDMLSRLAATPLTWVPRCQGDAREILLALGPSDSRHWLPGNQTQELGGMAVFGAAGAHGLLSFLDHLQRIAN